MIDAVPASSSWFTEPLTDFNDLAAVGGLDAVRHQVEAAEAASNDKEAVPAPLKEWPDPVLPGSANAPDVAALEVFEGWLGEYVHHLAEATQTPQLMGVLAALATVATCLHGRYEVAPKGIGNSYREPLAIWVCTAMPPGARKSAVMNAIRGPLVHWEKLINDRLRRSVTGNAHHRIMAQKRIDALMQKAGKAETEEDVRALQQQVEDIAGSMPTEVFLPRLFTGDTTVERLQNLLVEQNGRMAVHSDEGGVFATLAGLYSGGNVNLDAVLGSHDGTPLRVDRAGRKAHIDRPVLSFNLMTQPGVFSELADKAVFRHSGLLARFLFGLPASNVGLRDMRHHHDIPEAISEAYSTRIHALLEGWVPDAAAPRKPVVLEVTDAARELWFDFAQRLERDRGPGGSLEGIADWAQKAEGRAARVAALLEIAEFGPLAESVSESAMRRAIALMEKLIPHAQAALGMLGADAVDQDADAVLRWLVTKGEPEVKRQAVHNGLSWRFKKLDKLTKALDKLKANECIDTRSVPNKGARPSVIVSLNPKVVELIGFVQ